MSSGAGQVGAIPAQPGKSADPVTAGKRQGQGRECAQAGKRVAKSGEWHQDDNTLGKTRIAIRARMYPD